MTEPAARKTCLANATGGTCREPQLPGVPFCRGHWHRLPAEMREGVRMGPGMQPYLWYGAMGLAVGYLAQLDGVPGGNGYQAIAECSTRLPKEAGHAPS